MWIEIYFHLKYLDNCTRNVFSAQTLGIGSQEGTERRKWEPGTGGEGWGGVERNFTQAESSNNRLILLISSMINMPHILEQFHVSVI